MSIVKYTPLDAPNLAQDVDLLPYVYSTIQSASQGEINDFSPHSPIAALAEGLDFSIRELRYALNRFAFTAALNHLKIAGVQRRLGANAQVMVTFTLSAALGNPFLLSTGYMVHTPDDLEFLTDENLIIPPGATSGTVRATARNSGSQYNVPSYAIAQLSETRAFLKSVTNLEAATGGLNEETLEEVLSRGFAALRYRGVLITEDDFEQEAMRLLGVGSVAKAIGRLAADKLSYEKGSVHLFVLNPDGMAPSQGQLSDLQQSMQAKIPTFLKEQKSTAIASALYLSAIEFLPLEIYVIASLIPGDNPEIRAQKIYEELGDYLKPGTLPLGETVLLKELELVVRRSGVRFVQSVSIHVPNATNTGVEVIYADVTLPSVWTAATLKGLTVDLVDGNGNHFIYPFGRAGDPN
jgi:Baseplate J-like protein